MKQSEENNQKLKEILSANNDSFQKTISRLKKKMIEKDIEINYLNTEKSFLQGSAKHNSDTNQKNEQIMILELKKNLEIKEKQCSDLIEEINQLKTENNKNARENSKFFQVSVTKGGKNENNNKGKNKDNHKEIANLIEETKFSYIFHKIPFTELEKVK